MCDSVADAYDQVNRLLPVEGRVLVQQLEYPILCEISCTVLDTKSGSRMLPIVELNRGASPVLDANLKFGTGSELNHIIPARLDTILQWKIEDAVLRLRDATGSVGLTRTDILVLPDRTLVILEVNAIPGLLPCSIAVDAAAAAGIDFDELALRYAESAFLPRHEANVW